MISRFPDTLETSYDIVVKGKADAVVAACSAGGSKLPESLNEFIVVFEAWKARDFPRLEREMKDTRERLAGLTFTDPQNQETVEKMIACLDEHCSKLGMD